MSNKLPTVKERFLQYLDLQGFPKKESCEKIGMTYGNFTGNAKMTPLNSTAIGNILLSFPDLSADWLLTGRGSML